MAESYGLPPEENIPEEDPARAPEVWLPPEEGAILTAEEDDPQRTHLRVRRSFRQRSRNALLLAVAGVTLCGVVASAPMKPAEAFTPPAETAAVEPVEEPEPAVLTAGDRLVSIGTWKNSAEDEWVHFYDDGTGWWYDGTYFGRMAWEETDDGGVTYEAAIAYLGEEWNHDLDSPVATEREGLTINDKRSEGSIALREEEDLFTCPGLLYGNGTYVPDDTPIDASVMDAVRGKSNLQLVAGSMWHMEQTSDLGVSFEANSPDTYEEDRKVDYTDKVYVESIDFAACNIRLTTRDGGLLEREYYTPGMTDYTGEVSRPMDFPFTLPADDGKVVPAWIDADKGDQGYNYRSDYRPGGTDEDTVYNNRRLLFGVCFSSRIYMLFTQDGLRLGMYFIDTYIHDYTILAPD